MTLLFPKGCIKGFGIFGCSQVRFMCPDVIVLSFSGTGSLVRQVCQTVTATCVEVATLHPHNLRSHNICIAVRVQSLDHGHLWIPPTSPRLTLCSQSHARARHWPFALGFGSCTCPIGGKPLRAKKKHQPQENFRQIMLQIHQGCTDRVPCFSFTTLRIPLPSPF